MASKSQNPTPFLRLSRFLKPGPSAPPPREPSPESPDPEDWYIPYNGPTERPPGAREAADRDSWGELVTGWLREDTQGADHQPRHRATSTASHHAHSPTHDAPLRRSMSTAHRTTRAATTSFVRLDHAGGVGEAPMPARTPRPPAPAKPETNRHSLASILTRGLSGTIRHSTSAGQLQDTTGISAPPLPEQTLPTRRHPYAYPFSAPATSPAHAEGAPLPRPTEPRPPPAYLQPEARGGMKASVSTPNLRDAKNRVKTRQRWLSPETWCDALILPRPRFAIRVDPGQGSGPVVGPPAMLDPGQDPRREGLHKLGTAANMSPAHPLPILITGPSRLSGDAVKNRSASASGAAERAGENGGLLSPNAARPKSFALDDMALPSPVPSLSQVVEEGRQLEEDRKRWQAQAAGSFQNKRARSISRARAKSLASHQARARAGSTGRSSALDVLAERSLLGSQSRPPTVHLRLRPAHLQTFRASDEQTASGADTFASTSHRTSPSRARTRSRTHSHAHSNSVGTNASSRVRTDESHGSGADAGAGRTRKHSIGKSAMRLVRSTASNAANFCGFASAERVFERDREGACPVDEAAAAAMLDGALQREGTRVIRLQDQVLREKSFREGGEQNVVLITPALPEDSYLRATVPQNGHSTSDRLSPDPSGTSYSVEGVGIAISTPTPSDEAMRRQQAGRERLRMPAHPYAHGTFYAYHRTAPTDDAEQDVPPGSQLSSNAGESEAVTRRLPVLVHPYSPLAQSGHPYAANPNGTHAAADASEPGDVQEIEVSANSLYAELTPGHIREIQPGDLRYSPFIMVHPVETKEDPEGPRAHPYAPQGKRTSEWGFADALAQTLRDRGSVDGDLEDEKDCNGRSARSSSSYSVCADQQEEFPDDLPEVPMLEVPEEMLPGLGGRPSIRGRAATLASSNHTLASSPLENINPPSFRRRQSSGRLTGHSSGSSPGMVSHESSPPVSPRPLNAPDDLERFRDLFYQPQQRSRTPSDEDEDAANARLNDGVSLDVSTQSTRSVSGLTTLARQLAEDLEELREITEESYNVENAYNFEDDGAASLEWEQDLNEQPRFEEMSLGPKIVLSQVSSKASSSPEAASPLGFPVDQHASLAQPTINVPEDVELSSRASSILESPLHDEPEENLRLGTIAALSTPPPFSAPHRASSRLSSIHIARGNTDTRQSDNPSFPRLSSFYSSLGAPVSELTRSSVLTTGTNLSRMSGLSDFPVPPTEFIPEHMSVLNSYFDESSLARLDNPSDSSFISHPATLVRESSRGTFGRNTDVGQAL